MLQFRVDLARFLGTTYSGENLGLTFLFPSFHDVTPTTWLTSGFYLVFIAAICIFATRQHMADPAASCS
jgi:hypothetical protein